MAVCYGNVIVSSILKLRSLQKLWLTCLETVAVQTSQDIRNYLTWINIQPLYQIRNQNSYDQADYRNGATRPRLKHSNDHLL
jgi:hypothetical protein